MKLNKEIVILGSRGMLGQMVRRYFTAKQERITCFDTRFNYPDKKAYSAYLRGLKNAIVINCIGRIKQKTDDANDLLQVNTILPAELRNALREEVILIHPSTDCVFQGDKGEPYPASWPPDAWDDYGWSKRLGEIALTGRANTLIPRVSIIGPDENPNGKGLLAWFLSNKKGSTVKGFTNHLWNGITTLEWCRQIESFLAEKKTFEFQLIQYGTAEHYSKYRMLQLFNETYNRQLSIEAASTGTPVDRRLSPQIVCPSLEQQLAGLKNF